MNFFITIDTLLYYKTIVLLFLNLNDENIIHNYKVN